MFGEQSVHVARGLAPLGGEGKGRTAPMDSSLPGGSMAGAVRPLHALVVGRELRAPAWSLRERGGGHCLGARLLARATEQADQADEARVELECGMELGSW